MSVPERPADDGSRRELRVIRQYLPDSEDFRHRRMLAVKLLLTWSPEDVEREAAEQGAEAAR